jgi:hypothetical protein
MQTPSVAIDAQTDLPSASLAGRTNRIAVADPVCYTPLSDCGYPAARNLMHSFFVQLLNRMRKPIVFSLCASLIFSAITALNFAIWHDPGELESDSQLYANIAYNFALGRGFSLTNTGNCYEKTLSAAELRDAIVNDPGPYVPNHLRSPGGTVVLGFFLKLAGLDLLNAEILLNFFGHWAIGFFICMIMYKMAGNLLVSALALIMHYVVLTGGWASSFPVIPVNLFVVMTVYFAQLWLESGKRLHLLACGDRKSVV